MNIDQKLTNVDFFKNFDKYNFFNVIIFFKFLEKVFPSSKLTDIIKLYIASPLKSQYFGKIRFSSFQSFSPTVNNYDISFKS